MNPIMVKHELPGYLSDRLQEALWREALHIINEGYATTKDLDRAIEDGPGLRWSLMGTFLTFHLAGGKAGMKHMLKQFGPALKLPWTKLKAPKLSKKLSAIYLLLPLLPGIIKIRSTVSSAVNCICSGRNDI